MVKITLQSLKKNALKILDSEEPFNELDSEGFKGAFEKLSQILSR